MSRGNSSWQVIHAFYRRQSFQPSWISPFINPFFLIRSSLYKGIKNFVPGLKGSLMDFGCGRKPYRNLFSVDEYIGVDLEYTGHDHTHSQVDVFYDGKTIPFPDQRFDAVFCTEVVEHLFNPDEMLPEINRTLKPGGKLLLTVPFCWNEHEVPYDYARYSSFGIKHLLEKNGFRVIEIRKTGSFARVLFQLRILYFFELFRKWGKAGFAMTLLFAAPLNIIAILLLPLYPRNQSLYFNNVVLAEKQIA